MASIVRDGVMHCIRKAFSVREADLHAKQLPDGPGECLTGPVWEWNGLGEWKTWPIWEWDGLEEWQRRPVWEWDGLGKWKTWLVWEWDGVEEGWTGGVSDGPRGGEREAWQGAGSADFAGLSD